MTNWRLAVRVALFGLLMAMTAFAEFSVYNRYFSESGGAFCKTRLTEVELPKKQICISTGLDLEAFNPQHIGRLNMILIKYRDGILFDCFWFDSRAFTYSAGGWEPPLFEHCSKNPLDFEMRRTPK
jgi:hypothetical protein